MSANVTSLPVDLPSATPKRARVTLKRALLRHCPYCGGDGIFKDFFTLKKRCPHCNTLFAYEDGYFLGSYAMNIILMMFIGIAMTFALIGWTDLSVLQMQIVGVTAVIILPIVLYPLCSMLWMCLDLVIHPPGDLSGRPRK